MTKPLGHTPTIRLYMNYLKRVILNLMLMSIARTQNLFLNNHALSLIIQFLMSKYFFLPFYTACFILRHRTVTVAVLLWVPVVINLIDG